MSSSPQTDREVYRITPANLAANEGFEVVNPALCRLFERELLRWRALAQRLVGRGRQRSRLASRRARGPMGEAR
jgi:hypothetical protein